MHATSSMHVHVSVRAHVQVCERLPMVEVTWQAPRLATGKERKPDEDAAGSEQRYVLEVHLRRLPGTRGGTTTRAYTPRFPKVCAGHPLAYCTQEMAPGAHSYLTD